MNLYGKQQLMLPCCQLVDSPHGDIGISGYHTPIPHLNEKLSS